MKKVREAIFETVKWSLCGIAPQMRVNGLSVTFNMPAALKSRHEGGHELAQGLPPYNPRPAFPVLRFPGAPESWNSNQLNTGDFFVPVRSEHGGWLDFNDSSKDGHDVAVRVSLQGICAITGVEDHQLDELKRYHEGTPCPKHGTPFMTERFCPQCTFKWEAQNYLPSRTTPSPYLWLDGFRNAEGEVRQMVFTTDAERGVAAQLIGDRRTDMITVSVFRSKEPKPPQPVYSRRPRAYASDFESYSGPLEAAGPEKGYKGLTLSAASAEPRRPRASARDRSDGFDRLEVAAGAKIRQRVYSDNVGVEHYRERPDAVFKLHFAPEAMALLIIAEGELDLTANGEGALAGLKVGN